MGEGVTKGDLRGNFGTPFASTSLELRLRTPKQTQRYEISFLIESPRSSSWSESTPAGASHIKSTALAVLGKAITSRMLDSPAINALMRSQPRAMPPWGGV